jgi:hypothetical protein
MVCKEKSLQEARRNFKAEYGSTTYSVVRALEKGRDPYRACDPVWQHSVPAITAHYTRGTYDHHLAECNFQ